MRALLQKCARKPVSWPAYPTAGHCLAAIVNFSAVFLLDTARYGHRLGLMTGDGAHTRGEMVKKEQRRSLYEAARTEAAGLYKHIVTIATLVLGASLFVIEKLRPPWKSAAFWLMALGGFLLLASLGLTLVIRFCNIKSMALVAEDHPKKARAYDKRNICVTWIVIVCVTTGILLVGISVLVAASTAIREEHASTHGKGDITMSKKQKDTSRVEEKIITEKAIPSSSFFPEDEVEEPPQPEQPEQPQSENGGVSSEGSEDAQDGDSSGSDEK